MIKERIYLTMLITYLMVAYEVKSQSNQSAFQVPDGIPLKEEQINFPGEGTFNAKAWVKCISGDQLTLKPDIPKDPSHCYVWLTGKIENYSTPLPNCNLHEYEVKSCEESGVYLVKVYDKTGTIIHKSCFVVYIVTGLDIWERDGITECMDEYSTININGKLLGQGMQRVTTSMMPITITYYRNNIEYSSVSCQINFGKFQDGTFNIPQWNETIVGNPEGYGLVTVARWNNQDYCRAGGSTWIDVKRLWIKKFHHPNAPTPSDWQIVLNDPISYEALASADCTDFNWNFINLWGSPVNNNKKSGVDMSIQINNIANFGTLVHNADFGKTNGNILLTCKDKQGNTISVSSFPNTRYLNVFPFILYEGRFMNPSKLATVFFPREYILSPTTHPMTPLWVPLWGYYCYGYSNLKKIFHPWYKGGTSGYLGSGSNTTYLEYAITETIVNKKMANIKYYENAAGYDRDYSKTYGMHCFNATVIHESEHNYIREQFWPNGYNPNKGTSLDNDVDLDNYPDDWESNPKKGGMFNFTIGPKGVVHTADKYDVNIPTSWGTKYEEDRCHQKQMTEPLTNNDSRDWSYSLNILYQGKQWK